MKNKIFFILFNFLIIIFYYIPFINPIKNHSIKKDVIDSIIGKTKLIYINNEKEKNAQKLGITTVTCHVSFFNKIK